MIKLKLSLKNSIKCALLFNLLVSLVFSGCQNLQDATYKEGDIPHAVKKICKEEYNLDVTCKRTSTVLWIYAPLDKILDKEYGIKEGKLFDSEMVDKLRNILITIGRVLINSDNTPDFYGLVASDIQVGIDYTLIGNTLDIKKSYANFIPWTEANRRYVIKLNMAPEAIGDLTGEHLKAYDIKLPDFLAEQIAQRISVKFQGEGWGEYFKVAKSEGRFVNNTFAIEYSINEISKANKEIDLKEEILNIITYCIRTYEFKDFSQVVLIDLLKQDTLILGKAAILGRPME